jgi:hypothetical protein
MLLMQACEIVKANNLSDQVVVIHGRVEVRLPFYVSSGSLLLTIFIMCGNSAFFIFPTYKAITSLVPFFSVDVVVISIYHGVNTLLAT